ncbi:MAG: DUF4190 domain-containing protein [Oscillospiraceae bacterium]|nr:DUF4190 domain-containing protein [Oscillospiraceae bacterium]
MNEPIYDNPNTEQTELPAFEYEQAPEPKAMNNMAIAGFACAFLSPIPGLILSFMAHKKCQELNEDGQNLATAGIVIAVFNLLLRLLILVLAIALVLGVVAFAAEANALFTAPSPDIFGGLPPGIFW